MVYGTLAPRPPKANLDPSLKAAVSQSRKVTYRYKIAAVFGPSCCWPTRCRSDP